MENVLLNKLCSTRTLAREEWVELLSGLDRVDIGLLLGLSRIEREQKFGRNVYLRGLVEIGNRCRNHCLYCGIRAGNHEVERYRMSADEILACCADGYRIGFRRFVLQGGEDPSMSDVFLCSLLEEIRRACPNSSITLSLGERSMESYRRLYESGADRYLLRHETALHSLYASLHPQQSLEHRLDILRSLKQIGYWAGAGFLTGLPGHSIEQHADDFLLLQQLQPQMVGIGPFIPQIHTPLADYPAGNPWQTVRLLALVRLLLPDAFLPATTALATLSTEARIVALQTSANVIMPNLTPWCYRPHYALYDGKKQSGSEAAEELSAIEEQLRAAGLTPIHR